MATIRAVSPPSSPSRSRRGFGQTLGNSLRRVLLSSLQGAAITSIHVDGVLHEFSSIPGVREDLVDIVLNVKDIAVKMQGDGVKRLILKRRGPGVVTAGDIQTTGDIQILNPQPRHLHARRGRGHPHRVHGDDRQGLRPGRSQPRRGLADRPDADRQPLFAGAARFPTASRTPARARISTRTS